VNSAACATKTDGGWSRLSFGAVLTRCAGFDLCRREMPPRATVAIMSRRAAASSGNDPGDPPRPRRFVPARQTASPRERVPAQTAVSSLAGVLAPETARRRGRLARRRKMSISGGPFAAQTPISGRAGVLEPGRAAGAVGGLRATSGAALSAGGGAVKKARPIEPDGAGIVSLPRLHIPGEAMRKKRNVANYRGCGRVAPG
jgi:hypothetical protein